VKVWITGGAGFIGSHLAEHYCLQPGVEVTVLDSLRSGRREHIGRLPPDRLQFIEGSITDRDLVLQVVQGADYIFHLASRQIGAFGKRDGPAFQIRLAQAEENNGR